MIYEFEYINQNFGDTSKNCHTYAIDISSDLINFKFRCAYCVQTWSAQCGLDQKCPFIKKSTIFTQS